MSDVFDQGAAPLTLTAERTNVLPQLQRAVSPVYRRKAHIEVWVNGKNMTNEFLPYLISVRVQLKFMTTDRAHIELDDRRGELPIPPNRDAVVQIKMGWSGKPPTIPTSPSVKRKYLAMLPSSYADGTPIQEMPYHATGMVMVFQGIVNDVESGFSRRGGGRRLWIDARSTAHTEHWKGMDLDSVGEGDPDGGGGEEKGLIEFMNKIGGPAGAVAVDVDGVTADIKRKFWLADGESFWSAGLRHAIANGIGFKMIGNVGYFMSRENMGNGGPYPTIEATWGVNLIGWRIKPYTSRPEWKEGKQQFYDTFAGFFKTISKTFGGSAPHDGAKATARLNGLAPNAQIGTQYNNGINDVAERNRGQGWCTINGEPYAVPRANMVISGAREGVDGTYMIHEAEHHYDRGTGYITRCKLEHPRLANWPYSTKIADVEEEALQRWGFFESPFWADSNYAGPDSPPSPLPTNPAATYTSSGFESNES